MHDFLLIEESEVLSHYMSILKFISSYIISYHLLIFHKSSTEQGCGISKITNI
jgi:hypothetical protein